MFGCVYLGPGSDDSINLRLVDGQGGTIAKGMSLNYLTYQGAYSNYWIGEIGPKEGNIYFRCDNNKGRGATYEGPNGTYRTIHSSVLFGLLRNETKRNILMKTYMDYLLKISPIRSNYAKSEVDDRLLYSRSTNGSSGRIHLTLNKSSMVTFDLYTLTGKHILQIFSRRMCEGTHFVPMPTICGNGTYIITGEFENKTVKNKLTIIHN